MKRRSLVILLLITGWHLAGWSQAFAEDYVVATVGNDKIYYSEILQAAERLNKYQKENFDTDRDFRINFIREYAARYARRELWRFRRGGLARSADRLRGATGDRGPDAASAASGLGPGSSQPHFERRRHSGEQRHRGRTWCAQVVQPIQGGLGRPCAQGRRKPAPAPVAGIGHRRRHRGVGSGRRQRGTGRHGGRRERAQEAGPAPPGGTLVCANCGTEVAKDARFCTRCGRRLSEP